MRKQPVGLSYLSQCVRLAIRDPEGKPPMAHLVHKIPQLNYSAKQKEKRNERT